MLAGGAAGAVYWMCVYPADIIKSKLQTDNFRKPAFKGSLDCARQVIGLLLQLHWIWEPTMGI